MTRRCALALWGCVLTACGPAAVQRVAPTDAIADDVRFLSSPTLEGRAVGTPGSQQASLFLAQRYLELEIPGAHPRACRSPTACDSGYFQLFQVEGRGARNVLAAISGTNDPSDARRYVVLGAHFDHLGRSSELARDAGSRVRPGADDNASGTAALLELARRFAAEPPPVPVVFAHFDAEELGLLGSAAFADDPSVPLDSIELMVNLDMVGRLRGGSLGIEIPSDARRLSSLFDSLAAEVGIPLRRTTRIAGRSDHSTFVRHGVPAVALFTGFHQDYHRAGDTADKVDYAGLDRVVDFVEALIRGLVTR